MLVLNQINLPGSISFSEILFIQFLGEVWKYGFLCVMDEKLLLSINVAGDVQGINK